MRCPKCKMGELQESEFYDYVGVCENIDCGAVFQDTSSPYFIPEVRNSSPSNGGGA